VVIGSRAVQELGGVCGVRIIGQAAKGLALAKAEWQDSRASSEAWSLWDSQARCSQSSEARLGVGLVGAAFSASRRDWGTPRLGTQASGCLIEARKSHMETSPLCFLMTFSTSFSRTTTDAVDHMLNSSLNFKRCHCGRSDRCSDLAGEQLGCL